jgi:hypothetical protein
MKLLVTESERVEVEKVINDAIARVLTKGVNRLFSILIRRVSLGDLNLSSR